MEPDKNESNMNNSMNENKNGGDGNIVSDPRGERFFDFPCKRSLAERRGFNKNATITPLVSLPACSPHLTIPPGISPAALLDSPVMLPNSQVSLSSALRNFDRHRCYDTDCVLQ